MLSKGMFIAEKPENNVRDQNSDEDSYDLRDSKQLMSYYVMPKYGKNLEVIFN